METSSRKGSEIGLWVLNKIQMGREKNKAQTKAEVNPGEGEALLLGCWE